MIFGLIEEELLRNSMEKLGKSSNTPAFFIAPKEDWKPFLMDLNPKLLIIQSEDHSIIEGCTQIPVVYISDKKPINLKAGDEHITPPVSFTKLKEIFRRKSDG